jgi:catechol 2,3-dioxygenase-like lactoylglutathione lyase family enzyme
MKRRTLLSLGFGAAFSAPWTAKAQSTDPLIPSSRPEDARVGPLAMVTIFSDDPNATKRFYQGAMDMNARDIELTGRAARLLTTHLNLPSSPRLRMTIFSRLGLAQATQVRVIYLDKGLDQARPDHDSQYVGPLSLGFPVRDIEARASMLTAYGHAATAGVTVLNLNRSDGSPYAVKEAHFKGPDGVLSLGIDRGDMRPVGGIDDAIDIGGPAYSGMIVTDTQKSDVFFRDVLGFEKRRDVELSSSGPNGGLGLPTGTRFQFQQWFAPGAATGYLVVMRYLNAGKSRTSVAGSTTRGINLYSFQTQKLAEVVSRARRANFAVTVSQASSGTGQSAVIVGPDSIVFEVFEGN